MGWKNVKEHYRIKHFVTVRKEGEICIGSPYIHDIIVISRFGIILKKYEKWTNDDLARYQCEMDSDPKKLLELIETPDTFTNSITVYTYNDGNIIEKQCEEPGWPNVTHDGDMMHDNTYSTDKQKVIAWAKKSAVSGLKQWSSQIKDARKRLETCKARYCDKLSNLRKIKFNAGCVK